MHPAIASYLTELMVQNNYKIYYNYTEHDITMYPLVLIGSDFEEQMKREKIWDRLFMGV